MDKVNINKNKFLVLIIIVVITSATPTSTSYSYCKTTCKAFFMSLGTLGCITLVHPVAIATCAAGVVGSTEMVCEYSCDRID